MLITRTKSLPILLSLLMLTVYTPMHSMDADNVSLDALLSPFAKLSMVTTVCISCIMVMRCIFKKQIPALIETMN